MSHKLIKYWLRNKKVCKTGFQPIICVNRIQFSVNHKHKFPKKALADHIGVCTDTSKLLQTFWPPNFTIERNYTSLIWCAANSWEIIKETSTIISVRTHLQIIARDSLWVLCNPQKNLDQLLVDELRVNE